MYCEMNVTSPHMEECRGIRILNCVVVMVVETEMDLKLDVSMIHIELSEGASVSVLMVLRKMMYIGLPVIT